MYFKIAYSNVKKSIRDYTIYFLTLTFGICLFYLFNSIQSQQAVLKITESQKEIMDIMKSMISGISVFIALILGFLVIYANQFLMKRRHKEMGIYLILGMEKNQVSKILILETLFIGIFALAVGLFVGIFLSQGLAVLTAKMFAVQMKEFRFIFSREALIHTVLYFAVIFIIVMIFNRIVLSKYKLIDLLNSAKKNQKLKVKKMIFSVITFLVSIVCIGIAYHLIRQNGMMGVDYDFKVSILLGIIGTFLFFLSLSGFLLQLAKSKKSFYYKGLRMFVLRQINSKITTTFVSMTMICLMLFLALSAFATGSGLASTVKSDLEDVTKFDYCFYIYQDLPVKNETDLLNQLKEKGIDIKKDAKNIISITTYSDGMTYGKSRYTMEPLLKGREKRSTYSEKQIKYLYNMTMQFIRLSEYNKLRKALGKKALYLQKDQYILHSNFENLRQIMESVVKDKQKIHIDGLVLSPKYDVQKDSLSVSTAKSDPGMIVVSDEVVDQLKLKKGTIYVNVHWKANPDKTSEILTKRLNKVYKDGKAPYSVMISKNEVYQQSTGLSAVVTYIAIYIGLIFLITCAAVLALQQLSENADHIENYQLLRKLGTPQKMIYGALKAQIIIYFCIPLSLALVHSYVGITTASTLISTMGHMDITVAVIRSLIAVLIVYGGYMMATYFASRGMLKEK